MSDPNLMPQRNALERANEKAVALANEVCELAAECDALRSRVEALKKDKARLDWLSAGLVELRWRRVCLKSTDKGTLREAIDAAMSPPNSEPAPTPDKS